MKGTYRSVQKNGISRKTNFDEWSDPLLKRLKHKTNSKACLAKHEIKARLEKLKSKTAYSQTVNDIDNIRLMVKQGEPLLPQKDIRNLRLPLFNGLVLNLKDDGYPLTSEYIKELIVLDDIYSKHDRSRVVLRSNKTVLHKLAEGLKLAEDAKRRGDPTGEVQAFMDLALYFINSESSFSWLPEELLEQSVGLLNESKTPVNPKVEATLRFVYSSFLLDILHDLINAKSQLQISMKLSMGKNFWLINDDGIRDEVIFLKSCVVLSRITLEEAHEQISIDIEKAILSCRNSLHWAKQANYKPAIATALLTLAEFYLAAHQLSHVLDLLKEHIRLCKNSLFYRDRCEGYVLLSKYHETVGNDKEVVEVVEELISFALDKGILDIVMKAHLKLAEIYSIRRNGKMKYHALAAFKYCKLLGSDEEIELAKCLVGIGQGDQLMNTYVKLILYSNDSESDDLKKFVNWKNLRMPFFNDDRIILLYQSEIEENFRTKRELERVKIEEANNTREEKMLRQTRTSTRSGYSETPQRLDTSSNSAVAKQSGDGSAASSLRFNTEPEHNEQTLKESKLRLNAKPEYVNGSI